MCSAFAEKPVLTPYGFIKGEMIFADHEVYSFATTIPTSVSATQAGPGEQGSLGFTAQNTRLGLKGSMAQGEAEFGGQIEMDFWVITYNTNANPRMRLAYAWMKPIPNVDIRVGQQWDIFSMQNTNSNNTQSNFYQAGNKGFRRPQLQIRYQMDLGSLTPAVMVSLGESAKESSTAAMGADNSGQSGLLQARLQLNYDKIIEFGGAFIRADHRDQIGVFQTQAFGIDTKITLGEKVTLVGEFNKGKNFNNADMFSLGGPGSGAADVENTAMWANLIYKPLEVLHFSTGLGRENVDSPVTAGSVEKNTSFFIDIMVPMGPFTASVEYQNIKSDYKGSKSQTAQLVNLSGKLDF